jgi:hypothetical protein
MTVFMTFIRSLLILFLVVLIFPLYATPSFAAVSFEVFIPETTQEVILGNNERLYLGISYESDQPVRFQPSALHLGKKREVGARTGTARLHASGKAKALTWIAFDNPTHIDEVIVTVYDEAWQPLATESIMTETFWTEVIMTSAREQAGWVTALQKKERVKSDYLFDASPKRPDIVSDTFFVLSLFSIPIYIFLQIQMLRRYRLRWRELATVPLVTALPLTIYAFWVGIGFNLRLWPPFFMYFSLIACIYLLTLWAMKKIKG